MICFFAVPCRAKDLATFGAEELKEEDMSINASCFVHVGGKEGKGTFVVTGGENGHTHVWKITEGRKGREVEWKVEKVKEFSYHKGPIKAIRPHPTRSWVSEPVVWLRLLCLCLYVCYFME